MSEDKPGSADNKMKDTAHNMEATETITAQVEKEPEVNTGLGKAIASLFCFFPTGIIAIWFSARAGDYLQVGNREQALKMVSASKLLVKLSVIMFPVWLVAVVLIGLLT